MKRRRALILTFMVLSAPFVVCGLWLLREQQQYARNRQLIAALLRDDTKTALVLVNAGANPNTPKIPMPAPTFKSLLDRLLHHPPPPISHSLTAFQIACGEFIQPDEEQTMNAAQPHENVPLVRAMLVHGANVQALGQEGMTALYWASEYER